MQAFLYRHQSNLNAVQPLQIAGANVAFFTPPVMQTSEFLTSADGKVWLLRFFIGSEFPQTLVVKFDVDPGDNEPVAGRAAYYKTSSHELQIAEASQFLRKSDTLTLAKSKVLTANRTLLADRDGFAYFSSDKDQFKRILLCQALAIAYVQVIADCMARTTTSVLSRQTDEALALYENILRFNAAHYFSLPVQVGRHELFAAWKMLGEHYHLKVLNMELTQQLSDVAALLSAQREKQKSEDETKRISSENAQRELEETARSDRRRFEERTLADNKARDDKADKRRTYWLSLAGLFLTATSLLSLFEQTPTQFSDNVSQWRKLVWTSDHESEPVDSE